MPYITKTARTSIDEGGEISTPGELNYKLSRLVDEYISNKPGGLSYTNINEAIGVLECAKLELYRRLAAPYEDKKMDETGDVYLSHKQN